MLSVYLDSIFLFLFKFFLSFPRGFPILAVRGGGRGKLPPNKGKHIFLWVENKCKQWRRMLLIGLLSGAESKATYKWQAKARQTGTALPLTRAKNFCPGLFWLLVAAAYYTLTFYAIDGKSGGSSSQKRQVKPLAP